MTDEQKASREAFEAWFIEQFNEAFKVGACLLTFENGEYKDKSVQLEYRSWSAGWQASRAQPQAMGVDVEGAIRFVLEDFADDILDEEREQELVKALIDAIGPLTRTQPAAADAVDVDAFERDALEQGLDLTTIKVTNNIRGFRDPKTQYYWMGYKKAWHTALTKRGGKGEIELPKSTRFLKTRQKLADKLNNEEYQ